MIAKLMYGKGCGWSLFADAEGTNERGNERSLIYLMCHLRGSRIQQRGDEREKGREVKRKTAEG